MATQVEAVLFDVDNTLCEYHRTADESGDVQDLRERCFAAIAADRGRDPDVGRAVARAYATERDRVGGDHAGEPEYVLESVRELAREPWAYTGRRNG
jgi:FMN phosphatase YigB (HAD superfamily)